MTIIIKSPREIQLMREAGSIVGRTLDVLAKHVRPGVTTAHLDAVAEREITSRGAVPSFKGYRGYPASLCTSINDEVVHGIPGKRVLREGDIVSLDVGAIYKGYHGDAAVTLPVGAVSRQAKDLMEATQGALFAGIDAAKVGARLSDISHAIQVYAESRGYSVVREYVGHSIGREMHEDLQIPNFGPPGRGPVLRSGMTLALEPMVNVGTWKTKVDADQWTVRTEDGSLSAHFEHTIAITDLGAEILTLP
jgi:methionyl aminopeptidase